MAREWSKPFYNSKAWKRVREYIFARDMGLCQVCGAGGAEVHHKTYLTKENIHDPKITLNPDNLILLCKDCHSEQHERAMILARWNKINNHRPGANRFIFDSEGNMIENKNVTIVYGAPASGKTTYVQKNKGKYDIVLDLDYIRSALALSESTHKHFPDTLPFAIKIRDMVYEVIADRELFFDHAWVIATLPKRSERIDLVRKLTANLKHIDTSEEECLRRASEDSARRARQTQVDMIKKYFANYEP
jgi:predicted kinase